MFLSEDITCVSAKTEEIGLFCCPIQLSNDFGIVDRFRHCATSYCKKPYYMYYGIVKQFFVGSPLKVSLYGFNRYTIAAEKKNTEKRPRVLRLEKDRRVYRSIDPSIHCSSFAPWGPSLKRVRI